MSHYAVMIAEDLGVDVSEAAVVEEVLRVSVPTLDHLTRSQLAREARSAQRVLAELRIEEPEVARFYEEAAV